MINIQNANRFCCEDILLIENYYKAIADTTQVWELHHRLETEKNLSAKELISMKIYYHRPASELIFLTPFEHKSLHQKGIPKSEESKKKRSDKLKGIPQPWNSYKRSEETKTKMSEAQKRRLPPTEETRNKMSESAKKRLPPTEETRKKMSISSLGNKANTGYKWVHNNKERKMVKPDELEYYLNNGYELGYKLGRK